MIHLDTHIVVWLSQRRERKLSRAAAQIIRRETAVISPLVGLELAYLSEIDRLDADPERVMAEMASEFGIVQSSASYADVCRTAVRQTWTRDLFDRLIVSNAIVDGARLVTADARILDNFKDAVW